MAYYRVQTVVSADGKIVLAAGPFEPGDRVEVAVTGQPKGGEPRRHYPLRGKPIRYDRPFDSVAEHEP